MYSSTATPTDPPHIRIGYDVRKKVIVKNIVTDQQQQAVASYGTKKHVTTGQSNMNGVGNLVRLPAGGE
jgi:hypothetical protein